jgi:hypothetical protein
MQYQMIWLSSHLTYHVIISSSMWNVYSQIKQSKLKPLSHTSQPCFLYVSHHQWRLLCHHKSAIGIHSCLQCDFQSLVHSTFLESIMLFSSCSKDSLYPASRSRATILWPVLSYPLQRTLQRTSIITWPVIPRREIPFSPLSDNWMCQTYCVRTWPKYTVERYPKKYIVKSMHEHTEYEYHVLEVMQILIPSTVSVATIF